MKRKLLVLLIVLQLIGLGLMFWSGYQCGMEKNTVNIRIEIPKGESV